MFLFKKKVLEAEIEHIKSKMEDLDPSSKEYTVCANNLRIVMESRKTGVIDSNTKALIIANLAGILLILGYENAHIITSKAFGFIKKLY